jgi:predicted acylesterase/phospholipase RssA
MAKNSTTRTATASGARRDAMVLSGGGAKGAYEVGVMKALFEGASPSTGFSPLTVDIYSGTSVGAYNAAFMVANGREATDLEVLLELDRVWRERIANTLLNCGNGVLRIRGLPFQGFDPGCLLRPVESSFALAGDAAFYTKYFAMETVKFFTAKDESLLNRLLQSIDIGAFFSGAPMGELVEQTIDRRGLVGGPKKLTVVATNFRRGIPRFFSKTDIAGPIGMKAIAASAAIPGFFPAVEIDGIPFVDGGVTLNTPVIPVLLEGANVIHVVFVDPRVQMIPFPKFPSTLDTIYRLYVILIADNFLSSVRAAEYLAHNVRHLRDRALEGEELERVLRELERVNPLVGPLLRGKKATEPIMAPEIHVYRPDSDLGGAAGLLDFRAEYVDELISLGFRDTVAHDCDKERCIVPGGPRPIARPAA